MLLKKGDKIHVIERKRFPDDVCRHFLGEVFEGAENAVWVFGYAFVFDKAKNQYVKKPEVRNRIISLVDADNIINLLPEYAKLPKATYKFTEDNMFIITDDETFDLDLCEYGSEGE
jgi:hypothetical protein